MNNMTSPAQPPAQEVRNCQTCAHCWKRLFMLRDVHRCMAVSYKSEPEFCTIQTDVRFDRTNLCGSTRKLWTPRPSLRRFLYDTFLKP